MLKNGDVVHHTQFNNECLLLECGNNFILFWTEGDPAAGNCLAHSTTRTKEKAQEFIEKGFWEIVANVFDDTDKSEVD